MKILLPVLMRVIPLIAVSLLGIYGWNHWRGQAEDSSTVKKSHRRGLDGKKHLIETSASPLTAQDYQIHLHTQGILRAPSSTTLSAEAAGKVISISPKFRTGSFVREGDLLVQLDESDYQVAMISAEANLARSQANLAQEKARGEQARRNWLDIGFKEEPNDLVLRKPQLREAQAQVKSAEASLTKALRDKERCKVLAPFSGVIRNCKVGLGSTVGKSTPLGELLETDYAEVRLPLSPSQINQLEGSLRQNQKVTFSNALQPNSEETWLGEIVRKEGEMDLDSRELYFIAVIKDPFNLKKTHSSPLSFNQPLVASIPARTLKNVVLIKREHVQGIRDIIGILDNKVKRLKLSPVWEDKTYLVVPSKTLPKGLLIATSKISYAAEEAPVKVIIPSSPNKKNTKAGEAKPVPLQSAK